MKTIFITKKKVTFFISSDNVSESIITFQKKKKKITMGSMTCERNEDKGKR